MSVSICGQPQLTLIQGEWFFVGGVLACNMTMVVKYLLEGV